MWLPPIYKFLNKAHVRSFLRNGCIRVGTSAEYRVPDGKDGARADEKELTRSWKPLPGLHVMDHDHPFIEHFGGGLKPGETLNVQVGDDVKFVGVADAFIFSTCREYSNELAERMAIEFDANACICIHDPVKFFMAVSRHPLLSKNMGGLGDVVYANDEEAEFGSVDPLKKLTKFAWQKESRMIWQAQKTDVGTVIEVSDIISLISQQR
jgi:hypothetical protein